MNNTPLTTDHIDPLVTRWMIWGDEGLPDNLESRLRATRTYAPATITQLVALASELNERLEHRAPAGAVDHFLAAGDEWSESLDRRAALRVLERLSHLPSAPLAKPDWHAPKATLRRRLLTELEIGLVRHCSLDSPLCASTVGALDGGTASGELHKITPPTVRRDPSGLPTHLDGLGTERPSPFGYPVAAPRTIEIPLWARPSFARLVPNTPFDAPILYTGASNDPTKVQSAILMSANKALAKAGLGDDPTVKPLSIRNTAARRAYETSGLEAAAQFLGHGDFTSVAREIGLRDHLLVRER